MPMLCAIDFSNLHTILRSLYDEMMPLLFRHGGSGSGDCRIRRACSMWPTGYGGRWLLPNRWMCSLCCVRFAIGLCIMFFPSIVLGTINSVMSPIVQGTASMLEGQTLDMQKYREEKDRLEYEAMMKDPSTAYLVDDAEFDRQIDELGVTEIGTAAGMYIERGMYKVKKAIQNFFRELLEMLFQAASLTIDTIRTFFLIVLAILGPIAFALSVWDGFQSTLTTWIQRYIQTYLWLPVADLFSTILAKIQVLMLQNDISELTNNPNVNIDGSNICYIIFMVIGIVGYFTIPTVSGWIIQAGGAGNYNRAVNNTTMQAGSMAGSIAGGVAGNVAGRAGKLLK